MGNNLNFQSCIKISLLDTKESELLLLLIKMQMKQVCFVCHITGIGRNNIFLKLAFQMLVTKCTNVYFLINKTNSRWKIEDGKKTISTTFKLWTQTFKIRQKYMLFIIHVLIFSRDTDSRGYQHCCIML